MQVILLDVRYHRDPIGSDGTMLGEVQWRWFEDELRNSDAQIHIIGSSIQVVFINDFRISFVARVINFVSMC